MRLGGAVRLAGATAMLAGLTAAGSAAPALVADREYGPGPGDREYSVVADREYTIGDREY
ncbi:hypothetical protein [Jiangella alba]|uniref:Uncharacterized protein n=1 Tax=Jiangella alba TaxID=561176 RepID=A0A1H5LX68_9ACTN|nr:hypothetical protein [Jiangella alba]SEE81616.1 hypothetical protein SAMN04488561_2818 [Jiangella alba]